MPRKGRKRPDSFTLIVVPHTEKASFSVHVPFWTIYVGAGLCLIGLTMLALFALDYQDAASQLAELRRGGQVEIVQENTLLRTIAADRQQQDSLRSVIASQSARAVAQESERLEEATRFNDEVSRLYAQIAELEQFKADIRRIVGLDKLPPAATTEPSAPKAQSGALVAIGPLEPLTDERLAANLSSRGQERGESAGDALQAATSLLQNSVPQERADLESLRQEVLDRVSKVEAQWSSAEQLSRELGLFDASPRAWPVSGSIVARFGYDARRLELGAQPVHKGVDISAGVGAPVRAPQDGVITFAGWNGSFGLELEVRHSMGWSTLYAHLSSIPVKVGEQIKKGQIIGYVGMTGLTTGPHLHYEIHLNGTPLDPAKYIGK